MQNNKVQNSKLPFRCRMVCVSLVGGSLLLAFVFLLFYIDFISIEVALWVAAVIFVSIAIYESILLSLITRCMINGINKS
ncbi:MAG: hypothetical protein GY744_01055 [Gammaproteobacteria bacterium]|nr:hypothetical protein [Gammaproteobacteria bacterium]